MSGRRRILAGIGSGVYAQLIGLLLQVASVPVFLAVWGLGNYGWWVIVSTVQAYLALSEFGVLSAVGSRMTVLVSRGAIGGANTVLHAGILFLGAIAFVVMLASPAIAAAFAAFGVPQEFCWAAGILGIGVAVSQLGGVAFAVFQATGRNHIGLSSVANIRLAEWLGGMAGLIITASPVGVAAGMLLLRILSTALVLRKALSQQIVFKLRVGRWKILRLHMAQSLANFAITLTNTVSLQGTTLLVGAALGPTAVAVFNTYRTVGRTAVQATGILSHAAWPEFASAFGARLPGALKSLYRRTVIIGLGAASVAAAAIVLGMPGLLEIWTHGDVQYSFELTIAVAAYALAASASHVPRVFLTAIGRNKRLAVVATVSSFASILASAGLVVATDQLVVVLWVSVVMEALVALAAMAFSRRQLRRAP